jgi:hypothetical protein
VPADRQHDLLDNILGILGVQPVEFGYAVNGRGITLIELLPALVAITQLAQQGRAGLRERLRFEGHG